MFKKKLIFSIFVLLTISHFVLSQQTILYHDAVFEKPGERPAFVAIQVGNYGIKVSGDSILHIPLFPYNPFVHPVPPLVLNFNNLYQFLQMQATILPSNAKEISFDWCITGVNNQMLMSNIDILQAECLLVEAETELPLKNLFKIRFDKGDAVQDSFSAAVDYIFVKKGYRIDDISAFAGKRVYTKIKINHEIIDTTGINFYIVNVSETRDSSWANLLPSEMDYSLGIKNLNTTSGLSYRLYQNYPNPFNAGTTIDLDLYQPALVIIDIYNLHGERINSLVSEKNPAGKYQYTWNAINENGLKVTSGIYFCHIKIGDRSQNIKMIYLR